MGPDGASVLHLNCREVVRYKLHQGELDCKSEELGSVFRAARDAREDTDLVHRKTWARCVSASVCVRVSVGGVRA